MPLAIQVHHAVCDGFHVGRMLNELQQFLCMRGFLVPIFSRLGGRSPHQWSSVETKTSLGEPTSPFGSPVDWLPPASFPQHFGCVLPTAPGHRYQNYPQNQFGLGRG